MTGGQCPSRPRKSNKEVLPDSSLSPGFLGHEFQPGPAVAQLAEVLIQQILRFLAEIPTLRDQDIAVPEQLADTKKIGTGFQQSCGKRIPQIVRRRFDACGPKDGTQEVTDVIDRRFVGLRLE